jgi:hypothetical protein
MTLYEKIIVVYPELTGIGVNNPDGFDWVNQTYIELRNDSNGNGDYIAKWEHPTLAQPTQEQLDAVGAE